MRALVAIVMIVVSLAVLEGARIGIEITHVDVGETPVASYALPDANGPAVVVAHGFAGSHQMMQGFALPLARAGYRVYAFDFLGHGLHRKPMSGDVTAIEGTTQLLVDQVQQVMDTVDAKGQPVALLGHSMATDVLVRAAQGRADVGPIVLISAFSKVVDAEFPRDMLLVAGAWEAGLRGFALDAVQMVDVAAQEGQTVEVGDTIRRAVAAPFSEHVAVLQSRVARGEALAWLDRAYGRTSQVKIWPQGWGILGVLVGLVLLYRPMLAQMPVAVELAVSLAPSRIALIVVVPVIVAPLIAVPLNPDVLPVLVADYLGLHLLVFGVTQLALIWLWGMMPHRFHGQRFVLLVLWLTLFGLALDRYAANFWPTPERIWIIVVLALGAVPYMVADTVLSDGAPLWQRVAMRLGLLASLGIAVTFDFEGLFFVIMIAPVLILFYVLFGPVARQTRSPLAAGVALGLMLAWALGVSFPLFQA